MSKDYRKIAVYGRQSIDKKDSISIETQVEKCKAQIIAKDIDGEIVVYTDAGYSGKNTKRPEFQKMMEAVERDEIKLIVVYKLDRISRDLKDFTNMWDVFVKHKVEFLSVNETFDTSTVMGKAMLNITMVFAQMERETIQMRVTDNYYARVAKDGRWAGGPAPYGFINAKTENKIPTLEIEPHEMEMVKYVFHEYANRPNVSLGMLGRELYEKGYRSKRSNGRFDNITLARMLQNPIYVVADQQLYRYFKLKKINFLNNESEWDGTHSAHLVGKRSNNVNYRKYNSLEEQSIYITNIQGVIDSKIFLRVADRLSQNEQLARNNKMSNLKEFQGLIKCSNCGYAIRLGKWGLYCYGQRNLKCCDKLYSNVKFEQLRQDLGNEMQKYMDIVAKDFVHVVAIGETKRREIDELQKQIDNLVEFVAMGGKSVKTIHEKIEELQRKIDEKELENYKYNMLVDKLYLPKYVPIKYKRFSDELKKSICQILISKILLHDNGDMEIEWKI